MQSQSLKRLKQASKDYSFFGWMWFVYNITDKELLMLCNGEGFVYLYFQRTTANFFFFLTLPSYFLIIPLYLLRFDADGVEVANILKPTVSNAYYSPSKLIFIVIISLVYTALAYHHLYGFAKKINAIQKIQRKKVTNSIDSDIAQHTIHIRGINKDIPYLKLKGAIENFFEQNFAGLVASIQVIPNYDVLCSLIERKFAYQSRHDSYNHKNNLQYPKREKLVKGFINKREIDAEIYYCHLCTITDEMIKFYRSLDMKRNTGNIFVCFKSPKVVDAIVNDNNIIFSKFETFQGRVLETQNWVIKRAPSPSDIIWDNIKYTRKWRTIRMFTFTLILFIVCLIIITPNFINNELSPFITDLSNQIHNQDTRNIINEYSYTLIVVFMNSLVIPFIVGYIAMAELHYKRSYREKSIFIKNVIFMIVNCFFIPTFGVLNWERLKSYITFLLTSGYDWDVTEGLIKNSYFFMRYIIQVTFISNAIQLLSLPIFFVKKFRVMIARSDYEKFYASLIKKYFDYGYNYSFSITVFILTLSFSTTIPLIVPFGGLFFYLKYYIDKYNLLCAYPVEFESHGNITSMVLKVALIGIVFFQFIISNLFLKIFKSKDYAIYMILIYIVISIFIYYAVKNVFLSKDKDDRETIFDKILNRTGINELIFHKAGGSLFNDELRASFLRPTVTSTTPTELSEETLKQIMNDAYVHPAEKDEIVNPIQIWNDSYNYMKTLKFRKSRLRGVDEKKFACYEDIISVPEGENTTNFEQHIF